MLVNTKSNPKEQDFSTEINLFSEQCLINCSTVYSKGEDGGDPSQVCPLQAVSGPRGRRAAESTGTRHDTWQSTSQNGCHNYKDDNKMLSLLYNFGAF